MAYYRSYHISDTGETLGVENFVAATDAAAWINARQIQVNHNWHAFELWEAYRQLLATGEPTRASAELLDEIGADLAKALSLSRWRSLPADMRVESNVREFALFTYMECPFQNPNRHAVIVDWILQELANS
jgi:hypothetical protein